MSFVINSNVDLKNLVQFYELYIFEFSHILHFLILYYSQIILATTNLSISGISSFELEAIVTSSCKVLMLMLREIPQTIFHKF